MSYYTIHSGDECAGDSTYQVLRGPNGLEIWLTEPEDRNFYRDLSPMIDHLESLQRQLNVIEEI